MSHIVTVDTEGEVKDLDALEAACKALGCELIRGQKTWRWFGKFLNDYTAEDAAYRHGIEPEQYGHGEHAIVVPGAEYDVGLVRTTDGRLILVYDAWKGGKGIDAVLGRGLPKLRQECAAQVATKALRKQGRHVTRRIMSDGSIQLAGVK